MYIKLYFIPRNYLKKKKKMYRVYRLRRKAVRDAKSGHRCRKKKIPQFIQRKVFKIEIAKLCVMYLA